MKYIFGKESIEALTHDNPTTVSAVETEILWDDVCGDMLYKHRRPVVIYVKTPIVMTVDGLISFDGCIDDDNPEAIVRFTIDTRAYCIGNADKLPT
ncbi:MAG: hypothetical protein K6G36_02785 [Candidatus Saccharibacteria bacterium]|nr:hypothetical protein [Candidatus Saccharibacteria bacterium]